MNNSVAPLMFNPLLGHYWLLAIARIAFIRFEIGTWILWIVQ